MKISVLVPTYRRSLDLARCLSALDYQSRPSDEIVIVARCGDHETPLIVQKWSEALPIKVVWVEAPGQVNALNSGLEAISGDIVAITDDDAAPRPDWLVQIETYFLRIADLGGLGGRDWMHNGDIEVDQRMVGKVLWFGRIVGNHHLGIGPPRDVDILKGANMSFRTSAIKDVRFEPRLKGDGAQVHNDMAFSLSVKRKGWRLIYDPAVAVDHYPSIRHDRDQRTVYDQITCENASFNQYWAVRHCMQPSLPRFFATAWLSVVGTRSEPGIFWALAGSMRSGASSLRRWSASHSGRKAARVESRRSRQVKAMNRSSIECSPR